MSRVKDPHRSAWAMTRKGPALEPVLSLSKEAINQPGQRPTPLCRRPERRRSRSVPRLSSKSPSAAPFSRTQREQSPSGP
jgi:hypothetical protein